LYINTSNLFTDPSPDSDLPWKKFHKLAIGRDNQYSRRLFSRTPLRTGTKHNKLDSRSYDPAKINGGGQDAQNRKFAGSEFEPTRIAS